MNGCMYVYVCVISFRTPGYIFIIISLEYTTNGLTFPYASSHQHHHHSQHILTKLRRQPANIIIIIIVRIHFTSYTFLNISLDWIKDSPDHQMIPLSFSIFLWHFYIYGSYKNDIYAVILYYSYSLC